MPGSHRPPARRSRPLALGVAAAVLLGAVALAMGRSRDPAEPRPAAGPPPAGATAEAVERPNVLIVITDDQRADQMAGMPRTRAIFGRKGTRFTQAYATTPLCCPARASMFTGQYVHNHGLTRSVKGRPRVMEADSAFQLSTLQRYLSEAGYRTGLIGKLMNGWDLGVDPPYFDRWRLVSGGYAAHKENDQGVVGRVHGYHTDSMRAGALEFVRTSEEDDERPWFLVVALRAPHSPYTPAERHAGAAVPELPDTPAMSEADRSDKPPWVRDEWNRIREDVVPAMTDQARTLLAVDELVDDLFGEIADLGEDDTLAMFLSDQGMLMGEHGITETKFFPYTASVKIPLYLRWPGRIEEGAKDRRLVANIDLAPTILEAAGITPNGPRPPDGRSLLGPQARTHLLLEWLEDWKTPPWASLRTKRFQYIEYYEKDLETVIFREHYDLRVDPWQLENVLADDDPSNDPDVEDLHERLASARRCAGIDCP